MTSASEVHARETGNAKGAAADMDGERGLRLSIKEEARVTMQIVKRMETPSGHLAPSVSASEASESSSRIPELQRVSSNDSFAVSLADSSSPPECEICYEDADCGISDTCDHFFCKSCINRYLERSLNEGRFPLFCPKCREEKSTSSGRSGVGVGAGKGKHGISADTAAAHNGPEESTWSLLHKIKVKIHEGRGKGYVGACFSAPRAFRDRD